MGHVQVLLIDKLKGAGIVRVAAKHNLREIAAELGADSHIDAARVCLNRVPRGPRTADEVAALAKKLMVDAGVKPLRKDAVRALELLVTLPPASGIDQAAFFEHAVLWAESYFGAHILSAVVHYDEPTPHLHLLLLPLVDGHMVGSALAGRYGPMQDDFHEKVGRRYGLARQAPQKRHSAAARQQAMDLAFDVLDANSGLHSAVLRALLAPHKKNPEPLLQALGLETPAATKAVKGGFAKMMTRPCKPEKPKRKPIGFGNIDGNIDAPEKEQSLCSVGFASSTQSTFSSSVPQSADLEPVAVDASCSGQHVDVADAPAQTEPEAPDLDKDRFAGTREAPTTTTPPAAPDDAGTTAAFELDRPADEAEPAEAWQRQRDADQAPDCWDADQGEFVRLAPKPAGGKARAATAVRAAILRKSDGSGDAALRWAG